MIHFQIDEELTEVEFDCHQEKLLLAAEAVLIFEGRSHSNELSVVITSDEHIRQLNLQYLGIDAATDVLSFPAEEIDPETGNVYLGDILIAHPYVKDQAMTAGRALVDELQLLVVHGTLHLLGYDHEQETDRIRMWAAQAEILKKLGCADDIAPK